MIIIDDTQHSDNDSMKLFRTMIKQNTVFFILSFGRMFNGEYEIYPDILERARVRTLKSIIKMISVAVNNALLPYIS